MGKLFGQYTIPATAFALGMIAAVFVWLGHRRQAIEYDIAKGPLKPIRPPCSDRFRVIETMLTDHSDRFHQLDIQETKSATALGALSATVSALIKKVDEMPGQIIGQLSTLGVLRKPGEK